MPSRSSTALSILILTLTLTLASTGCERLNPSWCDEYAQCEPHEYCDPSSNTCVPRDAGPPRYDGADLHPLPDHSRLDRGPDHPAPKKDKGPDSPQPDLEPDGPGVDLHPDSSDDGPVGDGVGAD
jgi:hypothetical protein